MEPLFWRAWNHFRRQRECLWVVKQVKGVLYLTWLLSGRMLSSHRCRNMSVARHQAVTTWWIFLLDTWYLSFFLFSCPLGDPGGQLWEILVQNEKDKSIWNSSQWISTNSANFDMTLNIIFKILKVYSVIYCCSIFSNFQDNFVKWNLLTIYHPDE